MQSQACIHLQSLACKYMDHLQTLRWIARDFARQSCIEHLCKGSVWLQSTQGCLSLSRVDVAAALLLKAHSRCMMRILLHVG